MSNRLSVSAFACMTFACGPAPRHNNGENLNGVDGGCVVTGQENTPAECSDGIDNNCNGLVDCADPSCSGVGSCPVCGMVEHPLGQPFFLPDGLNSGTTCTTNAQCVGTNDGMGHPTPNCVESECHASYNSKVVFSAFAQGQVMQQVSDIVGVCVNMEHEWIRDLEIQLWAPSGQMIRLNKFEGRTGGEVYLGEPKDCDSCSNGTSDPMGPRAGFDYCWKPLATNAPMLDYANTQTLPSWTDPDTSESHPQLPAGDYRASDPWTQLVGATLNGDWQLVVTDLWSVDVGHIHSWKIEFNPTIVQNCSGPVIQ